MLHWTSIDDVKRVAQALSEGNAILGTSDTVVGLYAAVTRSGRDRLNSIKVRSEKPYIILLSAGKGVENLVKLPLAGAVQRLVDHAWPGPLTLILTKKQDCPEYVGSTDGTVAVRVPRHEGLQQLLALAGAVFSTSANKAGQPAPDNLDDVDPAITKHASYTIDTSLSDTSLNTVPSTILDCTGERIVVVRQGAYPLATLESIAGVSFVHHRT